MGTSSVQFGELEKEEIEEIEVSPKTGNEIVLFFRSKKQAEGLPNSSTKDEEYGKDFGFDTCRPAIYGESIKSKYTSNASYPVAISHNSKTYKITPDFNLSENVSENVSWNRYFVPFIFLNPSQEIKIYIKLLTKENISSPINMSVALDNEDGVEDYTKTVTFTSSKKIGGFPYAEITIKAGELPFEENKTLTISKEYRPLASCILYANKLLKPRLVFVNVAYNEVPSTAAPSVTVEKINKEGFNQAGINWSEASLKQVRINSDDLVPGSFNLSQKDGYPAQYLINTDNDIEDSYGINVMREILNLCVYKFYVDYVEEFFTNIENDFKNIELVTKADPTKKEKLLKADDTIREIVGQKEYSSAKAYFYRFLKDGLFSAFPVFFLNNVTRTNNAGIALGIITGRGVIIPKDRDDLMVVIHEIGHNLGLLHPFDYVIDDVEIAALVNDIKQMREACSVRSIKKYRDYDSFTRILPKIQREISGYETLDETEKDKVKKFCDYTDRFYRDLDRAVDELGHVLNDIKNKNYSQAYNQMCIVFYNLFQRETPDEEPDNTRYYGYRATSQAATLYKTDYNKANKMIVKSNWSNFRNVILKHDLDRIVLALSNLHDNTKIYDQLRTAKNQLENYLDLRGDLSLEQSSTLENIMDYVPDFKTNSFIAFQWEKMRTVAEGYTPLKAEYLEPGKEEKNEYSYEESSAAQDSIDASGRINTKELFRFAKIVIGGIKDLKEKTLTFDTEARDKIFEKVNRRITEVINKINN